jgi:hypothetical protein
MEIDDLSCTICHELYDDKLRIPRLIIGCGHTYCEKCLKEGDFICPEDNTAHRIINSEILPKNMTLIKLIKNKKSLSSTNLAVVKEEDELSGLTVGNLEISSKQEIKNTINITNNSYNMINISPSKLRSTLRKGSDKIIEKLCIYHGRPLEIICIEDREKICTNCALFGVHKNHNLINEEDFINEISLKTEVLIELDDLIDSNIHSFEKEIGENLESIVLENETRFDKMRNTIQDAYSSLIDKIREKEKEILEELNHKKLETNKKIMEYKNLPKSFIMKTEEWKNVVQNKLDKLNEINEDREEIIHLIDNNSTNHELISSAEAIVDEFIVHKNIPREEIDKILNRYYVEELKEYNMNFANIINIRDTDADPNLITKDIIDNFPKIDKNETFTTSANTIKGLEDSKNQIFSNNSSFLNISEDSAIISNIALIKKYQLSPNYQQQLEHLMSIRALSHLKE